MADDLTAELDRIAERSAKLGPRRSARIADHTASASDVPRLLAALRAVLELADRWDAALAGGSLHPHARSIREAISRELAGKGESCQS